MRSLNPRFTYVVTYLQFIKLEIWDRAQREAARRRKSDWGNNLGG